MCECEREREREREREMLKLNGLRQFEIYPSVGTKINIYMWINTCFNLLQWQWKKRNKENWSCLKTDLLFDLIYVTGT